MQPYWEQTDELCLSCIRNKECTVIGATQGCSVSTEAEVQFLHSVQIKMFITGTDAGRTERHWPAAERGRACEPDSALLWKTRWRACSGWAGRWSLPPSLSWPRWWWWSEQTPVQLHKHREKERRGLVWNIDEMQLWQIWIRISG